MALPAFAEPTAMAAPKPCTAASLRCEDEEEEGCSDPLARLDGVTCSQGSLSPKSPQHFQLWFCSSGLKLFAFFEALATLQEFHSPISHSLENKASEAKPKVRRSSLFKVSSSAGVKHSIKLHWKAP